MASGWWCSRFSLIDFSAYGAAEGEAMGRTETDRERHTEEFKRSQCGAMLHLWSGCVWVCVFTLSLLLRVNQLTIFVVKHTCKRVKVCLCKCTQCMHDYQNAQYVGMHSAGILLISDIFLLILADCRYLHIFFNSYNCREHHVFSCGGSI